jgi:hypothetical protein
MQHEQTGHLPKLVVGPMQLEWEAARARIRPLLIRQIEAAFDSVELGHGVSLHQARAMDDCASPAEIAAARALDTENRWQDITDEKLDRLADTLPFMDAEGFRFHIPRFMIFALLNEGWSWARDTAIYWTDTSGRPSEHLSLLSEDQRMAVEAFAEFYIEER